MTTGRRASDAADSRLRQAFRRKVRGIFRECGPVRPSAAYLPGGPARIEWETVENSVAGRCLAGVTFFVGTVSRDRRPSR